MDSERFDRFTRTLAEPRTRRSVLRTLGGAIAGGFIAIGLRDASAAPGGKGKGNGPGTSNKCGVAGSPCKWDRQCCGAAGLICTNGTCGCRYGEENCGGLCVTCPTNGVCSGTSCVCPEGTTNCGGNCEVCPVGGICEGNACVCPPGFANCNGVCVDDTDFCGSSCMVCPTDQPICDLDGVGEWICCPETSGLCVYPIPYS